MQTHQHTMLGTGCPGPILECLQVIPKCPFRSVWEPFQVVRDPFQSVWEPFGSVQDLFHRGWEPFQSALDPFQRFWEPF